MSAVQNHSGKGGHAVKDSWIMGGFAVFSYAITLGFALVGYPLWVSVLPLNMGSYLLGSAVTFYATEKRVKGDTLE